MSISKHFLISREITFDLASARVTVSLNADVCDTHAHSAGAAAPRPPQPAPALTQSRGQSCRRSPPPHVRLMTTNVTSDGTRTLHVGVIIRKCEAALVNQSGMAVTNRYKNPKLSWG